MDEDSNAVDVKNEQDTSSMLNDSSFHEDVTGKEPYTEHTIDLLYLPNRFRCSDV